MESPVSRRAVLGGSLVGVATALASHQVAAAAPVRHPAPGAPATVTGLSFPGTNLTRSAHRLINRTESRFLRNHSLRSFLFARAAAAQQGVLAGKDYDPELVFLICGLHDLGLTENAAEDVRFEVAGADLAAEFLQEQGADDAVVDTVWLAIAAHTSPQLHDSRFFRRRSPELQIAQNGIGIDLDGPGDLPSGYAGRVNTAYPRYGGGRALFAAIEARALNSPTSAPPTTLSGELLHQRHPELPYLTLDLLLDANGWGD